MHIDPFTIIIFNIIASFLMSAGLFGVLPSYSSNINGMRRWAVALLLQGIGWILLALEKVLPILASTGIGTTFILLSITFYFQALLELKKTVAPVLWTYWLIAACFLGQSYFVLIAHNLSAKIIIVAVCTAILLFANSFLLLAKQQKNQPISHKLTGCIFAVCACIMVVRAIYYDFWNSQPVDIFHANIMQDITYLMSSVVIVGTSFGFSLMCNDKYIAEKNQAQLVLEESLSLLHSTLESTADAILVVDLSGKVRQYNTQFIKLWKVPEQLLNTKSDKVLLEFASDQLVDGENFISEVTKTYQQVHKETFSELYFKDGKVIERYSRPQYLGGEAVGRVWSFRDITNRKRGEEHLCESERKLNTILDTVEAYIYIKDINYRYLYANRRVQQLYGYSLEAIIGKTDDEILDSVTAACFRENDRKVFESGKRTEAEEINAVNKDIYFSIKQPLFHSDGTLYALCGISTNITAQQRTQLALQESEAKFRNTFENAPIGIANVSLNREFVSVNQTLCNMLGYSREELCHMRVRDVVRDEDKAVHLQLMAQLLTGEKTSFYLEKQYVCKDGSLLWGSLSVRLSYCIDCADSSPDYFIVTVENIDKRKQIQNEILATKNQLQATLDAIPDTLFEIDAKGYFHNYHTSHRKLLIAPEQFIGKTVTAVLPEAAAETVMMAIDETWQQGWSMGKEFELATSEGAFWFEISMSSKQTGFGETPRFIVLSRDITERKQAEMQLRIAATIFESQEGMIITDADARILKVNKAFTYITGYSEEELINQSPHLLSSGRHDSLFYAQLWQTIHETGTWKGEIWNKRKNGEIYPEWATITAVKDNGIVSHYVATYVDITEHKQIEEKLLRAKEEAIAANQAKSVFLANMSHEIRTPMNAILGFSSILSDLITDKVHRYYLDAIDASGKTLLLLINDILDLSKIEAGKLELNYAPVEIEPILADIAMMFMQKMADKNICFNIEISENMPTCLVLDEIRLRQILLNIVGNAVKFTDKGDIRVSVTMQTASTDLTGLNEKTKHIDLSIAIEDSGMGIAVEQLGAIFSPFTQQKQQSVRYGGTGLGLSICKRLVEMMGGNIFVRSKLGEGSCFTIELPHVKVCSQAASLTVEKPQILKAVDFQPATVLLVDDIEFNRELLKIYLCEYPELKIIEAETGEQALDLIQQQHFDLVFMDRQLPSMGGDIVCEKIKALPGYADIPIIMISASVLMQSEQHPPFYNIQLNKPVNKTELLMAMQSFLPLQQDSNSNQQSQSTQIVQNISKEAVLAEKQPELAELLTANYQKQIAQLHQSGVFEINLFIEIAEQLIQIAEQYHCPVLAEWASALKSQTNLFDIPNLTKTLAGFEELLKQLQ